MRATKSSACRLISWLIIVLVPSLFSLSAFNFRPPPVSFVSCCSFCTCPSSPSSYMSFRCLRTLFTPPTLLLSPLDVSGTRTSYTCLRLTLGILLLNRPRLGLFFLFGDRPPLDCYSILGFSPVLASTGGADTCRHESRGEDCCARHPRSGEDILGR